ncbi:hypothetical protein EMMF5_000321 [Cystobasidiomycetes sp. EMM_F5]
MPPTPLPGALLNTSAVSHARFRTSTQESLTFRTVGFLSFISIIIVELFGSPFLKNASIIVGLAIGMIVAGPTGYVDPATIKSAPVITFVWVKTFKLRVYGPAVLPLMAVYISLAMEVMGDITASSEASQQPVRGLLYDSRIQGGILADGFNGLLSALMTNCPMSIFAQNNGVISITRCANRTAGYFCAGLMVFYGVLAKISGVFLAIPNPVLGGVTSCLKVISFTEFTRRNRIVITSALMFGLGTLLVEDWTKYIFTYSGTNQALQGFINSIIIVLSTPFLIAAIVGIAVNTVLPEDEPADVAEAEHADDIEDGIEHVLPSVGQPNAMEKTYSDDDIKGTPI